MFTYLRRHLRNNRGDANVSRMTMIAIVFVVGAILLVMTTSAFRSPINRWFSTVTKDWFADSNGMYEADNQWLFMSKNKNGTYENAVYILILGPDAWIMLDSPEGLRNGTEHEGYQGIYGPSTVSHFGGLAVGWWNKDEDVYISPDGSYIEISGEKFQAYLPDDPNLPSNIPKSFLPNN